MSGRGAPTRLRELGTDRGAVLVLYGLLLIALFGMGAIVLDLAALREDVRASRRTADSAAVAGALELRPGASRLAACEAAWGYVVANTPELAGQSMDCTDFPADPSCDPTDPKEAERTSGPYTVTIRSPVTDSELTNDYPGQSVVLPADGVPCERISVEIARTRGFVFGPVLASASGSSTGPAVALSSTGTNAGEVASLVLLDPTGCDALSAKGQGKIYVLAPRDGLGNITAPGIIVVDSDGTTGCGASTPFVIDADNNQHAEIKAGVEQIVSDRGVVGSNGLIMSYALATGNTARAFDVSDPPADRLAPVPTAGPRVTRRNVDHTFNCKSSYPGLGIPGCPDAATLPAHIDNLRNPIGGTRTNAALMGTLPPGYSDYNAWYIALFGGNPCRPAAVTVPAGSWWVNCPNPQGFDVQDAVVFTGGRVVFEGTVKLAAQGSLMVNPALAGEAVLYLRNGNLEKAGGAGFTLHNTFLYLDNGKIALGAGSIPLTWIAPLDGNFEDLALWSESAFSATQPHGFTGQGILNIEGIFFTPNALFSFDGIGQQQQRKAQFITFRLEVKGQGLLFMEPDPERNLVFEFLGVHLIR